MKRVVVVCPGRGSYTEASLGSLAKEGPLVAEAEALRKTFDLEPLTDLDGASKFEPARHLRPANVSPLIFLISVMDATRALEANRAVGVVGNSMGWYTALVVAGALSFADGYRLVQVMSLLQEEGEPGGQIIYPLVGDDWKTDLELEGAVAEALLAEGVYPSIHLGGYAVLAGTEKGISGLLRSLPKRKQGKAVYPFRLAQHGPYHTPLASSVASRARERLNGLVFRSPRLPLVDGRGIRFGPYSSSLDELRHYTLGAQVDCPFDFTSSVLVALREYAPEALVLPGPGNTLGGICGQVLLREGWRGIRSREDFDRVQASEAPVIDSMRR